MLCHPLRAAAGNVVELAFRSSANSTASTITIPSDVVAGDLLVLYDRATNTSGTVTFAVPSGFSTILNQLPVTTIRFVCSYKIATSTDASSSITGMNGTNDNSKILLAFSTGGATTAAAYDIAFQQTDGDPTSQTINASGQTTPLVVLGFIRQQTATSQSMSPTQDGTAASGTTNTAYYKIYNSSPADVTFDCGDGGTQNALMSFYIRVIAPPTPKSLYDTINDLGLTTNLKLCLDAGDDASYDPAVQTTKWLDTSGNGYDFFRGTSTSGDAAEPVFNGTAGELDLQNYWYFDGGDYFTYDTTNETWMNNLGVNNHKVSVLFIGYFSTPTNVFPCIFSTQTTGVSNGVSLYQQTDRTFRWQVGNGTAGDDTVIAVPAITNQTWVIASFSIDESVGAGGCLRNLNGSSSSTSSTISTPATGSAATMNIAGRNAGATMVQLNGSRLACVAIWEGTALTSQNLTDLYDALKGRFGL